MLKLLTGVFDYDHCMSPDDSQSAATEYVHGQKAGQ